MITLRRFIMIVGVLILLLGLGLGTLINLNYRTGAPTNLSKQRLLAERPAPWTEEATLRVCTWNIQDLPVVADYCPERMVGIAEKLIAWDVDVAGLQEAFVEKDRAILLEGLAGSALAHHVYFRSGLVGSGLLVVSKWPIEEVCFHRYVASNPWYRFDEGDWWAGKGVGVARIRMNGDRVLDFFNTHAQAGYGNPYYDVVRMEQMREMAGFIVSGACGTVPALVVGDFNSRVADAEHKLLVEQAKLTHAMTQDFRIDHIYVATHDAYTIEVVDTVVHDDTMIIEANEVELSDHPAYVSEVRIAPAHESL